MDTTKESKKHENKKGIQLVQEGRKDNEEHEQQGKDRTDGQRHTKVCDAHGV